MQFNYFEPFIIPFQNGSEGCHQAISWWDWGFEVKSLVAISKSLFSCSSYRGIIIDFISSYKIKGSFFDLVGKPHEEFYVRGRSSSDWVGGFQNPHKVIVLPYLVVVIVTNTLENFACTWILEPTMDLSIICSVVTSWLVYFLLSSWGPFWTVSVEVTYWHMLSTVSVEVTYWHMLSPQQVYECILLCKLEES